MPWACTGSTAPTTQAFSSEPPTPAPVAERTQPVKPFSKPPLVISSPPSTTDALPVEGASDSDGAFAAGADSSIVTVRLASKALADQDVAARGSTGVADRSHA